MKLFDIGFVSFRVFDIVDILLAALIIYALFKIIKGSIALNIFVGILIFYILWYIVKAVNMRLLSTILGQFIGVGVIAVLIVFQQEVRRFLLMVGKNRFVYIKNLSWREMMPWNWKQTQEHDINFEELAKTCRHLSKTLTGAIIIVARTSELKFFASTGVQLDADMSSKLLETIFLKKSPLHDGAVIMVKNKLKAASCILPVSEASDLPAEFGLRHRSGLGIAEQTDAMAIIVSEETGRISVASKGDIVDVTKDDDLGRRFFQEYYEVPAAGQDLSALAPAT
jgi:uncharacterized protein (TIGR00159 family)